MTKPTDKWWQSTPSPTKMRYLRHAVGQTALDIGTGAGFYGKALQEQDYKVTGVDLFERDDLPYPVHQGALRDLTGVEPADTVLAFDVLEHEADEASALQELRRLTKKRLLLSVPSGERDLLIPYNLTFKHHIDKTHEREYLLDELKMKLENAGFTIIEIQKEGPVSAALFAEFFRPALLRPLVRLLLKGLQRIKLLHNPALMADIYVVAEPKTV